MRSLPCVVSSAKLRKLIKEAYKRCEANMQRNNDGSFYGRGLASEGWDGGYLAALQDIDFLISSGELPDTRGIWK